MTQYIIIILITSRDKVLFTTISQFNYQIFRSEQISECNINRCFSLLNVSLYKRNLYRQYESQKKIASNLLPPPPPPYQYQFQPPSLNLRIQNH